MGFNEAQAQAIQHTDGPCLVLAGPGSGEDAYDCKQSKIPYRETESKTRRNSGRYFFTRFAAAEMKSASVWLWAKRSSGYSGYISWNLLWNPEMGLPDESGKYSFGDRKISDFAWRD